MQEERLVPVVEEELTPVQVADFLLSHKIVLSSVHGSLTETTTGGVYQKAADDWEYLPHRLEICQLLAEAGIHFGICSNEGGVGFGKMHGPKMVRELWKIGNRLSAKTIQYCVYFPYAYESSRNLYTAESSKRFPGPEMIKDALLEISARVNTDYRIADVLFLYHLDDEKLAAQLAQADYLEAGNVFTNEVYEEL